MTRARARDPQLTRAALNMDEIKIDKDGKVTGLDAQVESLKNDKAWLFEDDAAAGQSSGEGDLSTAAKIDENYKAAFVLLASISHTRRITIWIWRQDSLVKCSVSTST